MLVFLGRTYLADGAFTQACRMREQALNASEQLGDPNLIGWVTCRLADVQVLAGAWTQAGSLYERALTLFRGFGGTTRYLSIPLVGLGVLALREGNWEEASRYLEEGAAAGLHEMPLQRYLQAEQNKGKGGGGLL